MSKWYTSKSQGFYVKSDCPHEQCRNLMKDVDDLESIDDDEATVLLLQGEIRDDPRG